MSDFMPDIQFVTPGGRDPGRLGRIVLVLLWLTVCLAPVAFAIGDLELATGRAGTPGTGHVRAALTLDLR
ncbi:hypothetical protein AB0L65_41565 [Nonomuraea sp. NPDC052116]|uniref:hypothetical protein n=1 Tax=Nonomuraea sp. NPDC052116 TaxID=3155665 RepID=UPI0034400FED